MPVATGERLYTIYQFREVLNRNAAAYLRPDACLAGGLTNSKKIAALAEASYVGVSPPQSAELCAHRQLASSYAAGNAQYCDPGISGPMKIVRQAGLGEGTGASGKGLPGCARQPGLGVELNEEAFRHYPSVPYRRPAVVGPDGGLRDY